MPLLIIHMVSRPSFCSQKSIGQNLFKHDIHVYHHHAVNLMKIKHSISENLSIVLLTFSKSKNLLSETAIIY
jgi:hypothetical protein